LAESLKVAKNFKVILPQIGDPVSDISKLRENPGHFEKDI